MVRSRAAAAPSVVCKPCGTTLPRNARFCFRCGVRTAGESPGTDGAAAWPEAFQRLVPKQYADQLLAARGRPAGERRVITILFSDVRGSTAMAERLDPEEVMEIMNGAFAVLLEPVYRYEGTLARLMGDALLCFFGAPIAHEDDPQRACHCALGLLGAARAYAQRLERERGVTGFEVRVGIHTGLVVVGEVGDDLRVEYTAMGDAVNLAARLEGLAEPGTVLLSESTRRLVADEFEMDSLGETQVRGRVQSTGVYRLRAPRTVARTIPETRSKEQALVGRERELAALRTFVASVAAGQGQAVAATGEPGIGKSRLVSETRALWPEPARWYETRCFAYEANTSYGAARRLVRALLGAPPDADAPALRRALRRCLTGTGPPDPSAGVQGGRCSPLRGEARAAFSHLARLLALPAGDAGRGSLALDGAAGARRALRDAFRVLVRTMAKAGPLALVWEDVHWADASSLETLDALFALDPDLPVLVLLSFRSDDARAEELWARVTRDGRLPCCRLALVSLSAAESVQLAKGLVPGCDLDPVRLERLAAAADGNPFYVEQLFACVREMASDHEHGPEPPRSFLDRMQVPSTVQAVITARLDRLEPAARHVLQRASLFGREFDGRALARLCEPELAGADVADALQTLCARGFLHDGERVAAEFTFHHALTADVAYHSLLVSERRHLHARAGRVIEELAGDQLDEVAAVLAHHYETAGDLDRALVFAARAAAHAARLFAGHEAIAHYRTALRLRSACAPAASSQPSGVAEELAHLHTRLGDVHVVIGEYPEALVSFRQALGIATDPVERASLERRIGHVLEKQGRYPEARQSLEAGIETMGAGLDRAEAARIFTTLGLVYYRMGDLENAGEIGRLALEILETLDDARATAQACGNLALVSADRGEWARAHELHARALHLWERLHEPSGLAAAHNNLAWTLERHGDFREAVPHFQRAAELFAKIGNGYGLARAHDGLSRVYLDLGDTEQAQEHMERAAVLLADLTVGETDVAADMWQSGVW